MCSGGSTERWYTIRKRKRSGSLVLPWKKEQNFERA